MRGICKFAVPFKFNSPFAYKQVNRKGMKISAPWKIPNVWDFEQKKAASQCFSTRDSYFKVDSKF